MNNDIYKQIEGKPEYAKYLYRYGFLITTSVEPLDQKCFVLASWNRFIIGNYSFWIHPEQRLYLHQHNEITFFLIGHCYNPISMTADEGTELASLAAAFSRGVNDYCLELCDVTGIFLTGYIIKDSITLYGDAAGMFMTYYGFSHSCIWITSHAAMAGDLNGLNQSEYVKKLVNYRLYSLFGFSLPGDLSPYYEFKRLVPNHSVCLSNNHCEVKRFYPLETWEFLLNEYSVDQRAEKAARILSNSMALIPQKWANPAISLTGGCDSKTTLACAKGQYDHYQYFSYISQESEAVDANGAHAICNKLGLHHTIYSIPQQPAKDQELIANIIRINQGDIGNPNMREVQKRIFLAEQNSFDVEVKSWVSEIGRAYYHKRFAKKKFPVEPTARYLTTLYKVFVHNRSLVRETDTIFAQYMQDYLRQSEMKDWSWVDLFFWEFRVSSWNGLVITGEHRYSFDITIPYNNRRLLTLMLAVPEEIRMNDTLYWKIRACANPDVDAVGVQITNLKHTSSRAKMERLYLELHTRFPW